MNEPAGSINNILMDWNIAIASTGQKKERSGSEDEEPQESLQPVVHKE